MFATMLTGCVLLAVSAARSQMKTVLDRVDLGVSESEEAHNFAETGSELFQDDDEALGEPGRRLLLREDVDVDIDGEDWTGGRMMFDVKVAPDAQNYITVKFWGSEESRGGVGLMADAGDEGDEANDRWITGRKPSSRGVADGLWEPLWTNRHGAAFPGRWIYRTHLLPMELTEGKSRVRLRLQQFGGGAPPAIYSVYTHTAPHFTPPVDERQGKPFEWGPVKEKSEDFTLSNLKVAAEEFIEKVVKHGAGRGENGLRDLPLCYNLEWSPYYKDKRPVRRAAEILDGKAKTFYREGAPLFRWARLGRFWARPYTKLHDGFEKTGMLDEMIEVPGKKEKVTRRKAYATMFKAEFEAARYDRRSYTNQVLFNNTGLYFLNRALQQLDPEAAIPEAQARWYIYEIFGMIAHQLDYSEASRERLKAGLPLTVLTDKGSNKEYGYVGNYGELTVRFAELAEDIGDPLLKERAVQNVKTRAHMRRPANTGEGYRTMRGIDVISLRMRHYPAPERYGGDMGGDAGNALAEAAILQDPVSIRLAELYLEHHGEFNGHPIKTYEYYKTFKDLPSTDYRLPIEPEHGDYAWADEGTGVFMIRRGDSLIYGNLYFEPQLPGYPESDPEEARLRHITPRMDRVVDFRTDAHVPGDQEAPSVPGTDISTDQRWYAALSHAWFYQAEYDDFLIGMNTTSKNNYTASVYELDIPEEHRDKVVEDLVTGHKVDLSKPVVLVPRSTMVLYVGEE